MQTLHVFDLDGTLFDTYAVTKRAYEEAGLPEYKPEFWGKTAEEWRCPHYVHTQKRVLFNKLVEMVDPGWALPFYEVAGPQNTVILTSASEDTVDALRDCFETPLPTPFGCRLTEMQKRSTLIKLLRVGWRIYYYDDQVTAALSIVKDLDSVVLITERILNEDNNSCCR